MRTHCGTDNQRDGGAKLMQIIVVDNREQRPLTFTRFRSEGGTLQSGDYSIRGFESVFAIERKSVDDLCQSLTRERPRFVRELERLRAYEFKRLVIEGSRQDIERGLYRSKATPQSIIGSLHALEIRYGLPIVFAGDRTEAAAMIETWAHYFVREKIQAARATLALVEDTAGEGAQAATEPQQTAAAATTPGRPSDAAGAIVAPITATTATQSGRPTRNKGVKVLPEAFLKGAP